MKVMMKLCIAMLLMSLPAAGGCLAQSSGLVTRSQNGVLYVSGGIAADQQQALRALRSEFDLQLTFAAKGSGEFLADVQVNIDSGSGIHFVDATSQGPIFLAKLAPGTYQVTATFHGAAQTKSISIVAGAVRELYFYW